MNNPTAKVRLLRNVYIDGRPHGAGTVVELDVETALDCVEMMRGTFVDDAARERALQVRRDAIRKMLQAGTSSAWQRMH